MSAARKTEPVILDVEFGYGDLPRDFVSAVKFADRHNRRVVIGWVEDEKKIYLMTIEDDIGE